MTERSDPARAAADGLFRSAVVPQHEKSDAAQEYKAQQQALIDKTARLRALRLAKEKWQAQRLTFGSPTNLVHAPTSITKR